MTRRPTRGRRSGAVVAAARRAPGARRWTIAAATVVAGFALLVAVAVTHRAATAPDSGPDIPAVPLTSAAGRQSAPPWPTPDDVADAVRRAGLPMLAAKGSVEHIHAHLDVFVDGTPVTVPGGIGIDERGGRISPLHTHDTSGVIHIESPVRASFSLAQFFTEWQVALTATRLGGLTAPPGELRAYVNGRPVTGGPGAIILAAHDEIVLAYGRAPAHVPGTYPWTDL